MEEADGPIHGLVHPLVVLLPQVAHLPQQGLLPVHQVLREQTVVVPPWDPHTAPVPGTKLCRSCGISGCKPLPVLHKQLILTPSSPELPASAGAGQASRARHTSAPSTHERGAAFAPVPPGTCRQFKVKVAVPGPGSASGPDNRAFSPHPGSCRD